MLENKNYTGGAAKMHAVQLESGKCESENAYIRWIRDDTGNHVGVSVSENRGKNDAEAESKLCLVADITQPRGKSR